MTYPPDGGSFPGQPGEQPFPGRPGGQPHPGQQSYPQQPYPQQPRSGAYGQPGMPYGGQPGQQSGQQYVPPVQPGYGVPGGVPPQQPPGPGHPGHPGPGGPRRGRKGLLIGGISAALLVVLSLGFVVWNVADNRPYAELPTCRQLLTTDVVGGIPDSDRPRADGEYHSAEDEELAYLEEEGALGYLNCVIEDGDAWVMFVDVTLYEYEDDGEAAAEIREELEDEVRDREEGNHRDEDVVVLDWRPVSAGDTGHAVLYEGDDGSDEEAFGVAVFSTANVAVTVGYSVGDASFDEAEVLDFLDDFARQLDRQLSREGEKA